jgi:hypothetical protein
MVGTFLVVAGRRSGKTRAMAVFSVWLATCCDWNDCLSIGEIGVALFLSPVERQAVHAHRYASELIDHVPLFSAQITNMTSGCIELDGKLELRTEAANWRHNRGSTCISICFDESAFLRSADDSANSDVEILQALKPSLATTQGPMLLTSSPAGMEGVIYKIHQRHFGAKGDKHILVVQAPSRTLNPTLRKDIIDKAFEEDATGAAAEFGGEFRQPFASYLERSIVEKCVELGVTQRQKLPLVSHLAFVDPSGGRSDSFTCAIGHMQKHNGLDVCVVDCIYEARSPHITKQISELLKIYNINFVVGDAYGGDWPITAFAKNGIGYQNSLLSKDELYMHGLPLWMAGRVLMLDHPRAIDQLCSLKRKLGQAGREIIYKPKGSHDDIANCVAGLLWRLTPVQQKQNMPILPVLTKADYGGNTCFGDHPGGTSQYNGYTGVMSGVFNDAPTTNPAADTGHWGKW